MNQARFINPELTRYILGGTVGIPYTLDGMLGHVREKIHGHFRIRLIGGTYQI